MANVRDYEQSIINALAVSDANMNTALGTPVRKIITAVASEISKYAVDVNTTQTLYALDAVSGTELDYLVGQFGFTRQEAKAARGTVTIKRDNGDDVLQIAYGSQFTKPATSTSPAIQFQTTAYQELGMGVLSAEIAVVAITPGLSGNVPADTITYTGAYSTYITVTNENPTTGGRDAETDADLRTRFLNTVFRNVSGTQDQYMGLASAHQDVSRVNVVGQECRYSEIVQVSENGGVYSVHPTDATMELDVASEIDLQKRLWIRRTEANELIDSAFYDVSAGVSPAFTVTFKGRDVEETVYVNGIVFDATPCVCQLSNLPAVANAIEVTHSDGETVVPSGMYSFDAAAGTISFTDESLNDNFLVLKYKQVVVDTGEYITIEFDYRSKHNRGGSKTVDVYVDGEAAQLVSDIQFLDFRKSIDASNASDWVHKNASQVSSADGHLYLMLSRQPLISSTGSINVGTSTILQEGKHYNVLYDTTVDAGSTRAIDAIELIGSIDTDEDPDVFKFTADASVKLIDGTPISIPYHYNSDIGTIQELLDMQSVMTMDTLVHAPKKRYFTIPLDVMYSARPKDNIANAITDALESWANSLPFGATIQISDIETVVANVTGVDNVKLYSDIDNGYIREYARDGETEIGVEDGDFILAQDEIFVLRSVTIHDKSQQNW